MDHASSAVAPPDAETVQVPVLEYARAHVQPSAVPDNRLPVWDGPGFIGAFASGRDDVSERDEELLFTEHPADGDSYQ